MAHHEFTTVVGAQVLCKFCGKRSPSTPGTVPAVDDMNMCPQNVQQNNDSEAMKRKAEEAIVSLVVKHRLIEDKGRPKRTLSSVSKSHAFSSLVTKDRIKFGTDFFFPLVEPVATDAFATDGPDGTEDENKIHHPYFLQETKKLVHSALAAGQTIQQQVFWTKAGHWLKLDDGISAGVEPDFSTTDRVPGQPLVAGVNDPTSVVSKYDVAIAFEQKKLFAETDQMEIIDYGERLLCVQRGRPTAYTALLYCSGTDKIIRWAKTTESDAQFFTKISKPASLNPGCVGQRQLLTMLSKTSKELGRTFPSFDQTENGETLRIFCFVGEGATSTVYHGKLGDVEGVIKAMKSEYEPLANHEKQMLDHLNKEGSRGLLGCTKIKDGVLFFDKLLRPLTGTFSIHQVADILDCLEGTHKAGVVHRDIRPDNIMEDADGNVYLIDWGFAFHNLNTEIPPFEGTFRYGSEKVLAAAIAGVPHRPEPKDDLESFLKTVLAVNSGGRRIWDKVSAIGQGEFSEAKKFWSDERQQLRSSHECMFVAATNSDYAALKNIVY